MQDLGGDQELKDPRGVNPRTNMTEAITGLPMDCQHWTRPELFWHALTANQGDTHLPPHRQPPGSSASVGAQEIESTVRYLGIAVDEILAIAEQVDV